MALTCNNGCVVCHGENREGGESLLRRMTYDIWYQAAGVTYMVTEDADSPAMIWVLAVRDWSNSWEQNSEWIVPGTAM